MSKKVVIDAIWTDVVVARAELRHLVTKLEHEESRRLREHALSALNLAIQLIDDIAQREEEPIE